MTRMATTSALKQMFEPPAWYDDAACKGMDTDLFFPERGGSSAEAQRICAGCSARFECASLADDNPEATRWGVWGGMTARTRYERQRLRTKGRMHPTAELILELLHLEPGSYWSLPVIVNHLDNTTHTVVDRQLRALHAMRMVNRRRIRGTRSGGYEYAAITD